jgi:phage terminase large subunit
MNLEIKKSWINDIYHNDFGDYSTKFQIMYGGGGSGKSHYVVQKIIVKALKSKRNILIIRKTRASIKDSIYKLFCRILTDMKLIDFVKINKTDLEITLPTGSTIIFKGLDSAEKLKSIDNISDIVIEEATEITLEDFNQLKIRLRAKVDNQQIYLMFNPISKTNWVYDAFFNEETKYS